ncbi:MAG TPA: SRPBCC family protein [Burkholderiaceae bacterium]|jgi:ribosome-associated toxin RatA of RatAB toxin-antitoxin module|nr:SRPBCC family protein [Burkholderiaceae bacterium]
MLVRSAQARLEIRLNRAALAFLFLLGVAVSASARPSADVSVSATTQDGAVQVDARAVVHAPIELIWQTLTDYDHLSQFVPGIDSSRVVSRQGTQLIVEQKGSAHWWFFSYPIRVTVSSTERPYQSIDVRLLQGNLRRLDGHYRIEARPDGSVEVSWRGLIEPDTPIPAFIQAAVLRRSISDQFAGMVKEIERRADLWSSRSELSHP